ncbi:MAG TPA: hypothetical protein VJ812_09170, partial [Gemmatimonadaceae bacterium]|nr:hypothetical protein [Gemmatimonadaceae bacterium]
MRSAQIRPARLPALSVIPLIGALAISASRLDAQSRFEEIGSFQFGGAAVWVRATNTGMVQLFASPGYRDAFTKPKTLDALSLLAWLDSANTALGRPRRRIPGRAEPTLRTTELSSDPIIFELYTEGDYPGLLIKLGLGNEALVIRVPELSVGELLPALSQAAIRTREMTPPSRVVASRPPAA